MALFRHGWTGGGLPLLGFGLLCCGGVRSGLAQAGAGSVAERSAALASVLHDYTEDKLKHAPEYATSIADQRFNDQLDDLSAREVNERLAREQRFLERLGAIDTQGLSDKDRAAAGQLLTALIEDQERAPRKEWETPLDPVHGFQNRLEEMATEVPTGSSKDYDDYVARLKLIPDQFRQVITNMQLGLDEGRVQPVKVVETVLAEVNAVAAQKSELSVFASPLKRFPASIPPASRQRIADDLLSAIQDDVLPAYARFGRFLTAQVLPAAQKQGAK